MRCFFCAGRVFANWWLTRRQASSVTISPARGCFIGNKASLEPFSAQGSGLCREQSISLQWGADRLMEAALPRLRGQRKHPRTWEYAGR